MEDLLPRELWGVSAELTRVLDLTDDETLRAIGVERDELIRDDLQLTQKIGEVAYEHRFQAIRSVSVTQVDDVIAVMPENLAGAVLVAELVQEWRTLDDLH